MKIHVMGTNTADAVLAHEYRGVGVMEQITGKDRKFGYHLCGNLRVLLRVHKHAKPRDASSAPTNFQAAPAFQGRRITRGWVVTRRNS